MSKYQTIEVHALVTCFILQVHSARDTATANNVNTGKFTLQSTAQELEVVANLQVMAKATRYRLLIKLQDATSDI